MFTKTLILLSALTALAAAQGVGTLFDFEGTWSDNFYGQVAGGSLSLCHSGNGFFNGFYSNLGVVRARIQANNRLHGFWHEAGNDGATNWGEFDIVIPSSDDSQSRFQGRFWFGNKEDGVGPYAWSGNRLTYTAPDVADCLLDDGTSIVGLWEQPIADQKDLGDDDEDSEETTTDTTETTDEDEEETDEVTQEDNEAFVYICYDSETRRVRGSFENWYRDGERFNGAIFGWSLLEGQTLLQGVWQKEATTESGDYLLRPTGDTFRAFWWHGHNNDPLNMQFGGEEAGLFGEQPSRDGQIDDLCVKYNSASAVAPTLLVAAVAIVALLF